MPEATFWFSSPFREWIGQRTVTVRWEGRITLREVFERLAAEHPRLRANAVGAGLCQESFNDLAAVIMDGNFLALDSTVPDGAAVDVFTPLAGGVRGCVSLLEGAPGPGRRAASRRCSPLARGAVCEPERGAASIRDRAATMTPRTLDSTAGGVLDAAAEALMSSAAGRDDAAVSIGAMRRNTCTCEKGRPPG